jgi:tryptophan synthase beta chain
MTQGTLAYDFGDTAGLTPLIKMHTLGHSFVPPPVHAGGLRYHGMAPLVSDVLERDLIEATAVKQLSCVASGITFARAEGIIPAPESSHAIDVAIREAVRCREEGVSRSIVFGLSGHGHFDLAAYEKYLSGSLEDHEVDQQALGQALAKLPGLVQA